MTYIPKFDGNPKKFLDWIEAIERICEYKRYDERKSFKFAVHNLTENAAYWYERLKTRRRVEGKQKIQSWEKLKKHLKRKFLPRDYEQELYVQRIKSQIVRRKQEERKRLFLDTRDPPKPPMVEESNPHEDFRASMDRFAALLKEYQEEIAAKTPLLHGIEPQLDPVSSTSLPNQPMLEDMEEDSKEPIQEAFTYPMEGESFVPTSNMSISPSMEEVTSQQMQVQSATSLASEEKVQENQEPSTMSMREEHKQDTTSMASEEGEDEANSSRPSMEENKVQETHHQSALATFEKPHLQQAPQNLRANSFQEGEIDAGARGPKYKPNEVQTKTSSSEDLRRKFKPIYKNIYTSNNRLDELKYQNPP